VDGGGGGGRGGGSRGHFFFLAHTRCFCLPAWYGSLKIYKALLPPSHGNEKAEKEKEKSIEKQGTLVLMCPGNL
jgi:hypothetical protein